jgi:hypothetical protein
MMKKPAPSFLSFLSWLIKIAIVIAAAFYIYQKIAHRSDLSLFPEQVANAWAAHAGISLLALALVFLNWGLEAWKWKLLLNKLVPVNYSFAFRSILAGVTTGIFTPNRVGEFGGRVFYLEEGHRMEAALLSFAGGLLQLLVTVLAAIPAMLLRPAIHFYLPIDIQLAKIFVVAFAAGVLILYFFRNKWLPVFSSYRQVFLAHGLMHWIGIFFISLIRYGVFSFQFYLLLRFFGIHLDVTTAYIAISLTFFSAAVIPTLALSEIGVRGSVSLIFVGLYSSNDLGIIGASFLLWIINIALPAIAGSVFVLGIHPFKKRKTG